MANLTLQCVVIARLADYCDFRGMPKDVRDPLRYLWDKLKEAEEPLYQFKQELYQDAVSHFMRRAESGELKEPDYPEFLGLLDQYLAPVDCADALFHITPQRMADKKARLWASQVLGGLRVHRLLDEELLPPEKRRAACERLVGEIFRRLEFEDIAAVHERKPLTARRLRFIVRRIRLTTADYCILLRCPSGPEDTFTPFMLPRIEAVFAANKRLLRRIGKW